MNPFYSTLLTIILATAFSSIALAQTDITITGPASTSTNSVLIGVGTTSGYPRSGAINNTVIGYRAGANDATASQNTVYVGAFAGGGSPRGTSHTVGIGALAGYGQYIGAFNVMVGDSAGYNIGSAFNNVMVGASAGLTGAAGGSNTFVGNQSGRNTDSGGINTFIGFNAGRNNQGGNANAFFGAYAGQNHQSGDYNTFVGTGAGTLTPSGIENTFVGTNAGYRTTSNSNTMVGTYAGVNNTGGSFNTFIGVQAGQSNTTGSANFMLGTNAGKSNTTGSANFFVGDNAGGGNTTGGFNVYLGANAGNGQGVNGDNNVAIGFESGRANNGGVTNLFLGFRADAGINGLSNATAIGPNAKVNVSNALVLGNGANVGIGTSAPSARLEVNSGGSNTAGLKFTNLTNASPATGNQSKFLTVDGSGNVILGTAGAGGRAIVEAALWQRTSTGLLQSVQHDAVVIGQGVSLTPAGYSLFVGQGILAEKVKVAVKNTSDWSDKVFAPMYKLQSLSEVAHYITAHQHLPGVPSAVEVVEKGVDVAKMDAKLLEKIEELTLYSIQLEKSDQAKQRELQEQRVINQRQEARISELERLVNQLLDKK